jgi:hypothetical protein
MGKVVVPDPVIVAPRNVPSVSGPNPSTFHLYDKVPVFDAGFGGSCVGKNAVAIPTNVADPLSQTLIDCGCCIKDRIGPLRSRVVCFPLILV